jgi:hypothetical protein
MAESYLTLSEANDRIATLFDDAWDEAEPPVQTSALQRASAYLDRRFAGRWRGIRATAAQTLAWPRTGAMDAEGFTIEPDAIPEAVKAATAEVALLIIKGVPLEAQPGQPAMVKRESKKVGPIEKEIEYFEGGGPGSIASFTALDGLLAGLTITKSTSAVGFLARA